MVVGECASANSCHDNMVMVRDRRGDSLRQRRAPFGRLRLPSTVRAMWLSGKKVPKKKQAGSPGGRAAVASIVQRRCALLQIQAKNVSSSANTMVEDAHCRCRLAWSAGYTHSSNASRDDHGLDWAMPNGEAQLALSPRHRTFLIFCVCGMSQILLGFQTL